MAGEGDRFHTIIVIQKNISGFMNFMKFTRWLLKRLRICDATLFNQKSGLYRGYFYLSLKIFIMSNLFRLSENS